LARAAWEAQVLKSFLRRSPKTGGVGITRVTHVTRATPIKMQEKMTRAAVSLSL
jgi:hypothetical protein